MVNLLEDIIKLSTDNPKTEDAGQSTEELTEKLLYESFLPLSSLLFIIEINNLTAVDTKYLVEHTVIPMKNYLLSYNGSKEDALREFSAFGFKIVAKDKGLKHSLDIRNAYFEDDKSQIAKTLFLTEKEAIVGKNVKVKKFTENEKNLLDKKYLKMVLSLRKNIVESDNLVSAMKRERKEFIKNFTEKRKFCADEILGLKVKINLGGSIFAPNLLLQILNQSILQSKQEFIDKHVLKILKPIEELTEMIKHMSQVSKKDEIIKFLKACLVRDDWVFKDLLDEAFKARSHILELFLATEKEEAILEKEKALDKFQEKTIINLIKDIEDLPENTFDKFIILNYQIEREYLNFLANGQKENEKSLFELFEIK